MDVDEEDQDFVGRSLKRLKVEKAEQESQREEQSRKKQLSELEKNKQKSQGAVGASSSSSSNAVANKVPVAGSMAPPPVPAKKGTKRPAEDQTTSEFLEAASKKRKKGAELDPMDVAFNQLKIAKPVVLSNDENDLEGADKDGPPRLVVLHVPMFVRTKEKRVGGPVEVEGVANFKKFKKVSSTRLSFLLVGRTRR